MTTQGPVHPELLHLYSSLSHFSSPLSLKKKDSTESWNVLHFNQHDPVKCANVHYPSTVSSVHIVTETFPMWLVWKDWSLSPWHYLGRIIVSQVSVCYLNLYVYIFTSLPRVLSSSSILYPFTSYSSNNRCTLLVPQWFFGWLRVLCFVLSDEEILHWLHWCSKDKPNILNKLLRFEINNVYSGLKERSISRKRIFGWLRLLCSLKRSYSKPCFIGKHSVSGFYIEPLMGFP